MHKKKHIVKENIKRQKYKQHTITFPNWSKKATQGTDWRLLIPTEDATQRHYNTDKHELLFSFSNGQKPHKHLSEKSRIYNQNRTLGIPYTANH